MERLDASRYSAAQRRVTDAALDLFADYGVSGTSLQMIANAMGVTKAAVYHQFSTKEAIVLAVAEVELSHLQDAVDAAETEPDARSSREALLLSVIDLAVDRRRWALALQGDPWMVRLLGENEAIVHLMSRVYGHLIGDTEPGHEVRTAILSSVIGGAVTSPLVANVDDATLKAEILKVARTLFNIR